MKTYKKLLEDKALSNSTQGLRALGKQQNILVKNMSGFSYKISNSTTSKELESPQFDSNKNEEKKNTELKTGDIVKFKYKKKKFIGKVEKLLDNILWVLVAEFRPSFDNIEFETEEEKELLKIDLDDITLLKTSFTDQ